MIFLWHGSSFLSFTKILQEIKKGSNRGDNLECAEGDVEHWELELLL